MAVVLAVAPSASASIDPILGLTWTRFPGNPVLRVGPAGAWDSDNVVGGPVLRVNGTYLTWYVGSGDNYVWGTGLAASLDGVNWTKYPRNPILPFDGGGHVLYENGTFRMWYTYANPDAYAVPWQVRYATSPDGIHWTDVVNYSVLNVTNGAWDSYTLSAGPVIHDAGGYRMWYGATADEMVWRVGLATSPDGVNWTKYPGNPIIVPPLAGAWDDFRVHPSSMLEVGDQIVMWYVGADTNMVQRIGVANSTDGIHWTARPTPVLDLGGNGTWDAGSLSRVSVLQQGDSFRMWYTGINTPSGFTGHWQVGYATASLNGTSNDTAPPAGNDTKPGGGGNPGGQTGATGLSATVAAWLGDGWVLATLATLGGAGMASVAYIAAVRIRHRP